MRIRAALVGVTTVVVLVSAMVAVGGPVTASAAADPCVPAEPVRGTPVVLVHGWNSSADAMRDTANALRDRLRTGGDFTVLRFDYAAQATVWPDGRTAACLARYIVAAWRAGGRQEKVVVVGHSMGGIAARFASVLSDGGTPVRDAMAGLVTLGTPHRGSPWGDTPLAAVAEGRLPGALPPARSTAGMCLAPLDRRPGDCGRPPPLPSGVGIDQIGTQITIRRTLFDLGFTKKDADIPLFGDGIVPADSANGYVASARGRNPVRVRASARTVPCTYSTDYLLAMKFGARLGSRAGVAGPIIGAELATLGNILLDGAAITDIQNGRATPATLELTGYGALTPCFHTVVGPIPRTALPTEDRVLAAATDAIRDARSSSAVTRRVTVTPVDSASEPSAGWTVRDAGSDVAVECGYPSPAATTDGVQSCSPTAAAADVCWPQAGATAVVCLRSPWEKVLYRYPATNAAASVTAEPNPSPLGLELADGSRCRLRNGGSWSGRPEDDELYGTYSCDVSGDVVLWARRGQPEIDTTRPTWTVRKGRATGPLETVAVTTAFYAGTA